MKHLGLILCLCMALFSCGDNDSNPPNLNDISGVWDATTMNEGLEDELYIVISPTGEYTVYDYLGDEFNDMSDCYEKLEWTITDLGDGLFELQGDDIGTVVGEFERSGSQLSISDDSETVTLVATDLEESDFVPICSSLSFLTITLPEPETANDSFEMSYSNTTSSTHILSGTVEIAPH